MAEHQAHLLGSDTFWALVALLIFLAILIYLRVPQWLLRQLDERSLRIEKELAEASRLREEAQILLANYQKKRIEVEDEAKAILETSKREARKLAQETEQLLKMNLERSNKLAQERVAQIEKDAIANFQQKTVDAAITTTQTLLHSVMNGKNYDKAFDDSLNIVREQLKNRSLN